MAEGEGTGEGTPTGAGTGQAPAWTAQLPADLRTHEAFTKQPTIGDLGKTHLDLLGKAKELDGKVAQLEGNLKNVIPKLPENPTKEQINAFYQALGRPAKSEEYEFPKTEGIEHSPEFEKWAKDTFFDIGLPKDMAAKLVQRWDPFVSNMMKNVDEQQEQMKVEAEKSFRSQFESEDDYKAGYELAKRFWNKITETNFDDAFKEAEAWTVPLFMKFIFKAAKATGEDSSPASAHMGAGEVEPRIIFDNTPGFKDYKPK